MGHLVGGDRALGAPRRFGVLAQLDLDAVEPDHEVGVLAREEAALLHARGAGLEEHVAGGLGLMLDHGLLLFGLAIDRN